MMCFSRINPGIGRRLMPQTEPHSCARFTITLAQIRTADRSFGPNGSKPVRSDGSTARFRKAIFLTPFERLWRAINQQKVLDLAAGGNWNNLHEDPDLFSNQSSCGDCDFCSLVSHPFGGDD